MGKLYRFLIALLTVCTLTFNSTAAKAGYWDDVLQGISYTAGSWFNECDALSDEEVKKIIKGMCTNDASKAAILQENVSNSKYNECSNNVAKINFRVQNGLCKEFCEQWKSQDASRSNRDCDSLQKSVANMTSSDYEASVLCFKANNTLRPSNDFANEFNKKLARFLDFGGAGCWLCPVFTTVFNTVNTLATNLYNQLRDVFFALLIICAMAWLLWTVFKFMITLHGPNIGEFMTNLFKGLGTVLFVAIILRAPPSFITRYVVDIPVGIASGLSMEIINLGGLKSSNMTVTWTSKTEEMEKSYNGCSATVQEDVQNQRTYEFCPKTKDPTSYQGNALSVDTYDNMLCLLRRMSAELIVGMTLGISIFDFSLENGDYGLPAWDLFFIGIFITVGYFLLFVQIPFKLIDLLLRLGFVVILLPLFIVCFATPATRTYTKKGWEMFVSCWITLICLCLFIAFALQLIVAALTLS